MKLRNKLILSCAALAAVATTAVSTTYAWYTANTEVSASGISASTKTGSNETLLISKTGAQKTWGATATLNITPTSLMIPLEYDSTNDTYKKWNISNDSTTGTEGNSTAVTAAPSTVTGTNVVNNEYLSFMLYFKSGSTDNLNVKIKNITLINTTATSTDGLPTKSVMTETGLASVSSVTYKVDLLRALTVATNAAASTEVASGSADQAKSGATVDRTAYSVHNYQTVNDSFGAANASGFSAHQYYDAIKGTTVATAAAALTTPNQSESLTAMPVKDQSGAFATMLDLGQTGAGGNVGGLDNVLAVRFDIYLDGWDLACFDACQGQTFTLAMEFASSKVTG